MDTKKHYLIDCTLIKSHPDIGSVSDYLMDNGFIPDIRGVQDGIQPWYSSSESDAVAYAYMCGTELTFTSYPPRDGMTYEASMLFNASGTRIEILVDACGGSADVERGIMRGALEAYLASISPTSPIVFHLGEALADAYAEHAKQNTLPSISNAIVTDKPFHAEIVGRILNNISISTFDRDIERILMDTLGIAKDEAKFDHVFWPDTKSSDDSENEERTIYDNHFRYRGEQFTLVLTAGQRGMPKIEVQAYPTGHGNTIEIADIHDLKRAIDEKFFAIGETAPTKPSGDDAESKAANLADNGKPTIDSLMDDFTRRMEEIVSRTPEGEDWLIEFNEVASPREIVGYYLYTYGLSDTAALDKWKANTKCMPKSQSDKDVDEIFDAIFCPFCEQRNAMEFGSQECFIQLDTDGMVDCYSGGRFQGTFKFPNCPQCGKPIEKK